MVGTVSARTAMTSHSVKGGPPFFYIVCPPYTEMSSGVRCQYLLCHHLNRLGYKAFVTGAGAPPHLLAPRIGLPLIESYRRSGIDDIVIYPEVIAGNPFGGRRVARYLLTKPGSFNSVSLVNGSPVYMDHAVGMAGYGATDFFMHFADEFVPDGVQSFQLQLPLIDSDTYRERNPQPSRRGFVLYSHRHAPVLSELPAWVSPYTIVSMSNPRSPAELAALYQEHVALILWERSAACSEAIQCGCPVIMIPSEKFQPQPSVRRYRGNGIVIGWDLAGLERAQQTVKAAARLYWRPYRNLDRIIHEFVARITQHFAGQSSDSARGR